MWAVGWDEDGIESWVRKIGFVVSIFWEDDVATGEGVGMLVAKCVDAKIPKAT